MCSLPLEIPKVVDFCGFCLYNIAIEHKHEALRVLQFLQKPCLTNLDNSEPGQ